MAQYIKQGNIFGRLGTGIGKGFAEQAPKEMERNRLTSGLKRLGEQENLSPFQQFTGLVGAAHEYPQIVESGGNLLRQQAYLDSLKNQYQEQNQEQNQNNRKSKQYTPTEEELNTPVKGEYPTLATPESTAQSYKTHIPPTEQQERKDALYNFNKNPAKYDYNFDKALKERKDITKRNQEIQQAYDTQESKAVGKEEKLKGTFDKEASRLGIIPIGDNANFDPKLYQKFEEKIINSILPKSEGGESLSQEQAIKKYSDELLTNYENYKDLETLSAWSPIEFNRRINSIQKNFAPLGNDAKKVIMDKLIAEQQVSPIYAASKAYPISKGSMPTLNKLGIQIGNPSVIGGISLPRVNDSTYAKLKKEMGKNNSPLSVAYELQEKKQDPSGWLKYLDNNREDLEVWQANQLKKNLNVFDLKDLWLKSWE